MARADNKVFKIVLLVIGVVLLGLHMMLGPLFYYAPSFEGGVFDEQNWEPVEGAVVVVEWSLEGGVLHPRSKILHYEEAITDEKGRYIIDGWWPRLRPPTYKVIDSSPRIVVYKPGYVPATFDNPRRSGSWRLESHWDEKDIPLEPHANSAQLTEKWRYAMEMTLYRLQRRGEPCCPLLEAMVARR